MYLCYVDESGEAGTFQISDPNSNPFFVIAGLILEQPRLIPLTNDFLRIKSRFFPGNFNATAPFLDSILVEIKGSELRKSLKRRSCASLATINRLYWRLPQSLKKQ